MVEFARKTAEHDGWVRVGRLGQDARLQLRIPECLDALGERQAGQFLVGLAGVEGVERQLVPEHDANRTAEHLRFDRQARRRGVCRPVEHLAPAQRHRTVAAFEQRYRQGSARAFDHSSQQRHSLVRIVEIGDQLQRTLAGFLQGQGQHQKLLLGSFETGRRFTVAGAMKESA